MFSWLEVGRWRCQARAVETTTSCDRVASVCLVGRKLRTKIAYGGEFMVTPDFSLEFVLEPSDEAVEGRLNPKFLPTTKALQQQPFDGGDGQVRQG
jgi:hypothetical protein